MTELIQAAIRARCPLFIRLLTMFLFQSHKLYLCQVCPGPRLTDRVSVYTVRAGRRDEVRAAPVRPHGEALLDAQHQDGALDLEPIVDRTLVAVQARDLPVRVHGDALGVRKGRQDLAPPRIVLNGRLQVDRLNVDEALL